MLFELRLGQLGLISICNVVQRCVSDTPPHIADTGPDIAQFVQTQSESFKDNDRTSSLQQ
jgi:hypothetical protein